MIKKAFVTGGSRGIGAGIAEVLAESGYDIAITYNTEQTSAEKVAEAVRANGRRIFIYQASLELPGVAEKVTSAAASDLGGIDLPSLPVR